MGPLAAFRRLEPRRRALALAIGAAAIAVAGAIAGYGVLVLTTLNQPPPVTLPSQSPVASYSASDPDGEWVVDPGGSSFAGYRAREILAFAWIRSPNDAVGRTPAVSGELLIEDGQLTRAEIAANILEMRSDTEQRDGHLVEYLGLRTKPDAMFSLAKPIDVSKAQLGEVRHVEAVGTLTIAGVAREVVWPLDVRWSGDGIDVVGALEISRADFQLDVSQLLAFRVADTITLELQLAFRRPCPVPCGVAGSPGAQPTAPAPSFKIPPKAATFPPTDVGQLLIIGGGGSEPTITSLNESDLYLIRPSSGEVTNLSETGGASEFTPALSPDGLTVAYIRGESELWLFDLEGREGTRLTGFGVHLFNPDWSPDGSAIVAELEPETGRGLVRVDPATGAVSNILDMAGVEATPHFSPDGRTIAFSFFPTDADSQQLWLVDADGSNARQLTTGDSYDYNPDWSPDGSQIVFVRNGDLAVVPAAGGDVEILVGDRTVDQPAWSADGSLIAFVEFWRGELQLFRVSDRSITFVPELFEVVASPVWLSAP